MLKWVPPLILFKHVVSTPFPFLMLCHLVFKVSLDSDILIQYKQHAFMLSITRETAVWYPLQRAVARYELTRLVHENHDSLTFDGMNECRQVYSS